MSNSSGQKDPSMDEILGSIRRIITEDAQSDQPDAADNPDEDEILELTDEVGASAGDGVRLEPVLASADPLDDTDDDEEFERREPLLGIHTPGEIREPEPSAEFEETPSPELAAMSDVPAAEPAAETEFAPSVYGAAPQQEEPVMAEFDETAAPAAVQPAAGQPSAATGDMVSGTTSAATTNALGELSKAMDERVSRLRIGEGGATVSDIVKELIRPMLAEWIDQNLPGLVERVVKREIQKLVDRTQDDD